MLVLTRKVGEKLIIGDDIEVTVLEVRGKHVRIGICAPDSVKIVRAELQRHDPNAPSESDETVLDSAEQPSDCIELAVS
jgi:carbon storage regulator